MLGTVTRGLTTGAVLTAATGATMMISSTIERGSPWASLNAMASAVLPKRRVRDRFDAAVTPVGLLALTGGLLVWGLGYQGALKLGGKRRPLVAGVLSALGGYGLDKLVLPDRLLRNFRRKMGPLGTFSKYAVLGLTSAAAARALPRALTGKRIAVLAAEGFEQVELTVPVKALRAEGAQVEIVSLRAGKIHGMQMSVPGRSVRVHKTLSQADAERYDGLLIPGGFMNPDFLRQSEQAREFVRLFDSVGKPIAVICHAPWVLASAGLLKNRQITSWPGIRDDLVHAGAYWRDEPVVRDGNLLSSRGPHDLPAFVSAMIDLFAGRVPLAARPVLPATSDPQPTSPPKAALAGAALLPKVEAALRGVGLSTLLLGGAALIAMRKGIF